MSGQLWSVPASGGYLYSAELSNHLRLQVQPLTKFRQFCDVEDAVDSGKHRGETFNWNVYLDISTQGTALQETEKMPESNFTILQRSLTVTEYGNSVPFTAKVESLGKHDVVRVIDKTLRNDARKCFDIECYEAFDACDLRVGATSGTSTTAVTIETGGASTITNDVALGTGHIKALSDAMIERNIPPYKGDDYFSISHPSTLRTMKNSLETIHQYTEIGIQMIFRGEVGRYESTRFCQQNQIPKGGAADSTTFNPVSKTADAWNNAKSSWGFFFGADAATEAVVIPEEIRAKIAGDYGRDRGVAWYYLGGFAIIHTDALNGRVIKWDSAA
ncbi:MAG: hypothetical protein GY952_14150 [Rhodobacteraceae bacterium]|nr:hypothetical protein [Paracoccaceae bacterium]